MPGAGPALLTKLAAPFSSRDQKGFPSASEGDSQANGVGGGVHFPRWKGVEANPIALPGAWNTMSGDLGLESWKSAGQPRDNPESRSARLWNYSQVPKGRARFLGNPAVWGHIHTGAELCPEKIISHLRLVCVCAFGAVMVPFTVGRVTVTD